MEHADATEANGRTVREAFEAWQEGRGHVSDLFAHRMVIDGTAFYDSIAFDDLWSRVVP